MNRTSRNCPLLRCSGIFDKVDKIKLITIKVIRTKLIIIKLIKLKVIIKSELNKNAQYKPNQNKSDQNYQIKEIINEVIKLDVIKRSKFK